MSYRLLNILLIIIFVGISSFVISAYLAQAQLKVQINLSSEINDKSLQLKLNTLASELENAINLYKTSNQKTYWEVEGRKNILALLHSEGYYSPIVDQELSSKHSNVIKFNVEPWQRYRLAKIGIIHADKSNKSIILPDLSKLKIKQGQYAVTSQLIAAQDSIISYIESSNCLLSLSVTHSAVVNYFDDTLEITYIVDAGSNALIGRVEYSGLKDVNSEYVDKIIGLKKGQCFKRSTIQKARSELQKSGLFASTSPSVPEFTDKDGSVPVTFNLIERNFKSVKTGLSYGTDLGFGAKFGWEHRNYFGNAENVQIDSFFNRSEQIAEINYNQPFYSSFNQKLMLGSRFENKKSKAFDNTEIAVFGNIERKFSQKWSGGYGSRIARLLVKTQEYDQRFLLLSIPVYLKLDTRKNLLNPKNGHQVNIEASPFFAFESGDKPFLKLQISASKYLLLRSNIDTVIALRIAHGTILGISSLAIPINEKFYVGGAGSIRGYGYQLASEIDNKNRPVGGKSFIETAVELRLNLTDTLGVVGFLDSGRTYSTITPNLNLSLRHGIGFGVRYITDFGPIRFDIGFPVERRKSINKSFQLYFGIGQSF